MNPFINLETVDVHLQSCRQCILGLEDGTSPEYHLDAATEALEHLYRELIDLLPIYYKDYIGNE